MLFLRVVIRFISRGCFLMLSLMVAIYIPWWGPWNYDTLINQIVFSDGGDCAFFFLGHEQPEANDKWCFDWLAILRHWLGDFAAPCTWLVIDSSKVKFVLCLTNNIWISSELMNTGYHRGVRNTFCLLQSTRLSSNCGEESQ